MQLAAPEVDFLCAPYQYARRGAGGYDGPQSLNASVKLHGKLFLTECDGRLFTTEPRVAVAIEGIRPTPAESFAVLKRDLSHNLIARQGLWWMDLIPAGGWYHHPDIGRFLARARSLLDRSSRIEMSPRSEVAVIVDEESPFYLRPGPELLYPLVFLQDRTALCRMGAPYDIYLHNDLARPDMPEYKLYIFLNTLYLTKAERKSVKNRICRDNKVAVWMYGPGVIDENGISPANMKDLTGIDLGYKTLGEMEPWLQCRVYLTDYDHPITRGCESGTYFGSDSPISPVFYAKDPDARTLGRLLASRGTSVAQLPAFVIKEFPSWKSIFISAPNVPAGLLRATAAFSGCHIYADTNDIIYANSHYVAIHTDKGGRKRIRLPRAGSVYDAFTEELVASGVTEFTDTFANRSTKVYFLGDLSQIRDETTRFKL